MYARSPGLAAATAIQATPTDSKVILSTPKGALTLNLPDLEPRNHLYVTAGVTNLPVTFSLDTTLLADGYHQLTAVAYEGSDVRTQTQLSTPITIQNSSLTAGMIFLDATNAAPVTGTYHVQVSANAGNVSSIALYSTGGTVATVSNSPSAIFSVTGANLGVGIHPFYAVVATADGHVCRTATQSLQFTAGP